MGTNHVDDACEVTLRFASQEQKQEFLGQLSDGWGENHVMLDWEEDVDIGEAKAIDVMVLDAVE